MHVFAAGDKPGRAVQGVSGASANTQVSHVECHCTRT
jgi:hypothetical protein